MNFYKHHIGDYAAATAHLTFTEDAAFTRLLRIYYRDERPLPVEVRAVQRLAGARMPEELEAVETVLREFFTLTDDGWHNKRCDEEIAKAQEQAATNRRIAEEREARRKSTKPVQAVHEPLHDSLPEREPSHKPLATSQTPLFKQEQKATVQPAAAQRATAIHFDRFWSAYPNKKGKKDAERHWKREGCDAVADELIAHVRLMMTQDDGWRRGYYPMGSTYLNGRRWEDVPTGPPKDRLSKTAQALIALEGVGNGLDGSGSQNGYPEIDLPRVGSTARIGSFGGNGNGVG